VAADGPTLPQTKRNIRLERIRVGLEGFALVTGGSDNACARAVAAVSIGTLLALTPATASMPDLKWRGADRVAILCQVTTTGPVVIENSAVAQTLCARVKAIADKGAPVPVEVVGLGHAALQSGNTVALLVQASVAQGRPEEPSLLFTVRTDRTGGLEPAPAYFGTALRAAPFTSAADGAAWDGALRVSLSEVLPWLRQAKTGEFSPIE
jgi:hypothetical protein